MSSPELQSGPQAAARVARTITGVAGIATLVFLGLAVSPIVAAAPYLDPTYGVVGPALVFGLPPILAIVGLFIGLRALRRMLAAYAVVFLLVVVLWAPALRESLPAGLSPWPLEVTALGTVPAAIAWRPPIAWAYLVLNSLLIAPIRLLADGGEDLALALQYGLFTLTFASIFTALAMVAMRNGYALDSATETARATTARAAAAASRAQEQSRLDALVHDNVMATLYYASQGQLDDSVRRQAAKTLAQLEQLRGGRNQSGEPVTSEDFVARIRSVVLDASPEIDIDVIGSRGTTVPANVAEAFAEATSEAVRNSLTHAVASGASPVTRSAHIAITERNIRVVVRDDGQGFDTRDVSAHRLGIVVSIRGRLGAIPGANAVVDSRRGLGTVVTLSWAGR